jgi:hypothetical protein
MAKITGVECSDRERSARVGERGGAAATAPQGQAHQAAEARDRVQEGQISGQSRNIFFMTFLGILLVLYMSGYEGSPSWCAKAT